ncbi:hypothetical protein J3R30DRAFT_309841 [Lentinula aciculospora]|uniref:ATP-dependent DNA helicase n=1 Tax=Lentinula aciculospora TaxID=153920 RepID=A0A9W9A8W7_9AGAR|nr:hypothetical protein J3R30DRAFT_309841 [Lentinula aciculospora]
MVVCLTSWYVYPLSYTLSRSLFRSGMHRSRVARNRSTLWRDSGEHSLPDMRSSSALIPTLPLQLVLSGDFCQLPPVPSKRDSKKAPAMFAFEAQSWNCVGPPVVLKKVFRQKDQAFVNMLNEMRFGTMSESTINAFKALNRTVIYDDGVQPTELFPHRADVDRANNTRLQSLPRDSHTYQALDIPGTDTQGNTLTYTQMDRLLERLVVPKIITLKVGLTYPCIRSRCVVIATGGRSSYVSQESRTRLLSQWFSWHYHKI